MTTEHHLTAQQIFDSAPLGAIIRYSDGTPRPPDRFKHKLHTWKSNNASGRLMSKRKSSGPRYPDGFKLHTGDYGSRGVVILSTNILLSVTSSLRFEIEQLPEPGSIRVLHMFGEVVELLHVAASRSDAEAWLQQNPYSDTTFDQVAA